MALHRLAGEPEHYGAAALLIVIHLVRNVAARDAKAKREIQQLLQHAATDAEKLDDDFGRATAAPIRRVLTMSPLADPRAKH